MARGESGMSNKSILLDISSLFSGMMIGTAIGNMLFHGISHKGLVIIVLSFFVLMLNIRIRRIL